MNPEERREHLAYMKSQYQTVDQMIVTLTAISKSGKGHYTLSCNDEYTFGEKGDPGRVEDDGENVDFSGNYERGDLSLENAKAQLEAVKTQVQIRLSKP